MFLKIVLFFLSYIYWCVYGYVHTNTSVLKGQKRASDLPKLELLMELRALLPFAIVVDALNESCPSPLMTAK